MEVRTKECTRSQYLENLIYLHPECPLHIRKVYVSFMLYHILKEEFLMRNPNRDIFGEVKETVSVPSAAEYYGMSVRNGMTSCIFHEDRNPSMKLYDDHFYCFGCTEYGDVVKLTARLFGLLQYEAAKKLCSDFGIIHSRDKPIIRQKICVQSQREKGISHSLLKRSTVATELMSATQRKQ